MGIYSKEIRENIWLVTISGRLDQSATPPLEAELNHLLQEDKTRLILDLSETTYINSGGLRCLVTAWRKAKQKGGNVLLTGLQSRVREVFAMVGFDKVFQIYDTPEDALEIWLATN